jgi:hypothetical protein
MARESCVWTATVPCADRAAPRRACSAWGTAMRHMRLRALMLAAMVLVPPCGAGAADLVLVNQSGMTLDALYVSPCAGRHWGPNQLAGAWLGSSRSFTVSNLEPGCYDLKVVLPPWNECVINGAAIFKGLVWTITWSTATEAAFEDCSRTSHIVSVGRRPWIPYDRER